MIVVADTTPLNYLVLIGEIEVLASLYEKILIPPAVHEGVAAAEDALCSLCLGLGFACLV